MGKIMDKTHKKCPFMSRCDDFTYCDEDCAAWINKGDEIPFTNGLKASDSGCVKIWEINQGWP
jgi:hypothetical protein